MSHLNADGAAPGHVRGGRPRKPVRAAGRVQKGQSELNLIRLEADFAFPQKANFKGVLALKIKGKIAFQPNQV